MVKSAKKVSAFNVTDVRNEAFTVIGNAETSRAALAPWAQAKLASGVPQETLETIVSLTILRLQLEARKLPCAYADAESVQARSGDEVSADERLAKKARDVAKLRLFRAMGLGLSNARADGGGRKPRTPDTKQVLQGSQGKIDIAELIVNVPTLKPDTMRGFLTALTNATDQAAKKNAKVEGFSRFAGIMAKFSHDMREALAAK